MMRNTLPATARSSIPDNLDVQLLHGTQEYLDCIRRHRAPCSESDEAWTQFFLICDPVLRRFAISCRVPREDLDDCVQSAWREIIVALPAFRDDGQLRGLGAWLYLIVHSKVMDLCRYRARHPVRSLSPNVAARLTSRDGDSTAEHEQRDWQALMRRVLAAMRQRVSPTNYRVFELRLVEGHSVRQVATELGLTVEQVRYRCCRMKRKFRLIYDELEVGND
jgi:RNA polymerase sigma factor (sigma-70 family)